MASYIRFDWAMKRLLRDKANFAVLEGLLTTLLDEKITIVRMLESESNQEEEYDKYNRVDMLAENSKGELILVEVQNNNEYAYFQRMLFGTSKLITEYIKRGEGYEKVRKVYSINIVYFSLGSGGYKMLRTESLGGNVADDLRLLFGCECAAVDDDAFLCLVADHIAVLVQRIDLECLYFQHIYYMVIRLYG